VQDYYSCSGVLQGYRRGTGLQGSRFSSEVLMYGSSTREQGCRSSTVLQGYNYSARVHG